VYLDHIWDTAAETHLGFECVVAPTVCPCVHGGICLLSRADTVLSGDPLASGSLYHTYNSCLAALTGPNCTPDCWKNIKPRLGTTFSCVCGQVFPSDVALDLHITVASSPVGSVHDWPPETHPRVAGAYVIFDVTDPNPFRGVIAAAAFRLPSRGHRNENSTSSEEQAPVGTVEVQGGLQVLDS
jgi:hypothetical protein